MPKIAWSNTGSLDDQQPNFEDEIDLHNSHSIFKNGLDALRISILHFIRTFIYHAYSASLKFRLLFTVEIYVNAVDSTDNRKRRNLLQ